MKRLALALVALLGFFMPALAGDGHEKEHGHEGINKHSEALAVLMQDIRGHFGDLVDKAFLTSVLRQLKAEDFSEIGQEAGEIAGYARKVREEFSKGKNFDRLARDLEEHAGKVAKAAEKRDLPDVNKEIGEMAEYCAKCHDTFRW